MGYTHYWYRDKELDVDRFMAVAEDCRTICESLEIALRRSWATEGGPLFDSCQIHLNGKGEDAHEDFHIARMFAPYDWQRPDEHTGKWFEFCKTCRKPYDLAVQACLIVLKHHLNGAIVVASDGFSEEWDEARKRCQEILGYGNDFSLE